jgi:hypothetical protein
VSSDFTIDELYRLIKITDDPYQNCGLDEVLALLSEYIGDERIKVEVDKYIDAYYEDIGLGKEEEND